MSNSELCHRTPEHIFLIKIRFKLTLPKYQNDENLKTELLDIIKRGNMTRYYEDVCKAFDWKIDENLLDAMKHENELTWKELESSDNLTLEDTEKRNWREKFEFFCETGNLDRATDIANSVINDETNSSSIKVEAAFGLFRIAHIKNNIRSMGQIITKITNLMEGSHASGSNWCCRNKLKVYEAVYYLATRNFPRAACLLLDCIPTFESYELLPFKEVVEYTTLSGIISLSRSELDSRFNNNGLLQQALLTEAPKYRAFFYSLYDCHYKEFFENLAWIECELRANPLLHFHYRYYVREMRLRAYCQLLQAYRTINLSRMATEFGVTEEYIEQEVAHFIANGKLHCKIDKVAGMIVTISAAGCNRGQAPDVSCDRGLIYQNIIKRGDFNEIMAKRILTKYPRSIYKGTKEIKQPFNYLLVLDFECTCKKYEKIDPQEIIEFPCAAVSTTSWKVENVFHEYIKPKYHPQLTPFCTELTGIMQDLVDNQPCFPEVFGAFCNWLEEHKYFKDGNDSAFVTCGDWDLKFMLPSQCELENISLPKQFMKWINLKGSFCDAIDHYPRNLTDMLLHLNLPLIGKLHSGMSDVENMVQIIQALQSRHNVQFKINNVHHDALREYVMNK
ncbi:26S proteasome non-ATPase regulatory subunit 6-like [Bombus vosnesenskii]|uniref:26S proteasome non-ATPase regulatory subunit 6-like n=1 Tax=Bombus vosnesenskii TaxID=207650 RepID=A0A6J3KT78_9HYME|nr:26S proteasome non-ATPase regulatory subunit 6-like [Bombus vosnesenskii]